MNTNNSDAIEHYKWQVAQDNRLRDVINDSYVSAQIENIKGQRKLVSNFITISSGVIGFTIPIFGGSGNNLVKSSEFLIGGLTILLVVVLYGFYYLRWVLQSENKSLLEQNRHYNDYVDQKRDAFNKFFSDQTEKSYQNYLRLCKRTISDIAKRQKGKKIVPDYALDIIYGLFAVGLISVTLSLTGISLWVGQLFFHLLIGLP